MLRSLTLCLGVPIFANLSWYHIDIIAMAKADHRTQMELPAGFPAFLYEFPAPGAAKSLLRRADRSIIKDLEGLM
jgi:hypothetical protein